MVRATLSYLAIIFSVALSQMLLNAQTNVRQVVVAESAPPAPAWSAGLINDCLRQQDHWFDQVDLGGKVL